MKKRVSMLLVFMIGLSLFATSILASTTSKSGYEILRDSFENTILSSYKLNNFTINSEIKMMFDGKEVYIETLNSKNDYNNNVYSSEKLSKFFNEAQYYSYKYVENENSITTYDGNNYILMNGDFSLRYRNVYLSPFIPLSRVEMTDYERKNINSLKKIADAAVTSFSMQNIIAASKDGNKGYNLNFSFSEGQVPALINVLISVIYVQQFQNSIINDYNFSKMNSYSTDGVYIINESTEDDKIANNLSVIENIEDLWIKNVKGEVHINREKIIDRIFGRLELTGVDDEGNEHDIEFEAFYELVDIDSTNVSEPDLTGKNIINRTTSSDEPVNQNEPQKSNLVEKLKPLLGKYVSNIVEIKDNQMVKTGEHVLEITEIDEETGSIRAVKTTCVHGKEYSTDIILKLSNFDNGLLPGYYNGKKERIIMVDLNYNLYEFSVDDGFLLANEFEQSIFFIKVFE